jgi:hypothetical protein
MKISNVENVLFNPFFTSRLLHYALSGAEKNQIKTELVFFILPLIYNPRILSKLASSTTRTRFDNILGGELKNDFIFFDDLVQNFRNKTNTAIIILSNTTKIELNTFIRIEEENELSYAKEKDPTLKQYYKASYNLGSILTKEDYKNIFYKIL